MKITAVKVNDKYFISDNTSMKLSEYTTYHTKLMSFEVNGKTLKPTSLYGWYEIDSLPEKIIKTIPEQRVNTRYVLNKEKASLLGVENLPEIIPATSSYFEAEGIPYENKIFYDFVFDVLPEKKEEVEFELTVYDSKNIEPKFFNFNFGSSFESLVSVPANVLQFEPCVVKAAELYSIFRNYIKTHLDYSICKITSDYDFCFEVQKLYECLPYTVSIPVNPYAKKVKYENKIKTEKMFSVFEMAPKSYNSYTVLGDWYADSAHEMEDKINSYLKDLIAELNEPLKICDHCNGHGYIKR